MDRVGAEIETVLSDIRMNLTEDVCFINDSEEDISESLNMDGEIIEFIAERDEKLIEKYINGEYQKDLWITSMKNMIKKNRIFPCMMGSALQDTGIEGFINKLDNLTFTGYSDEREFGGFIYKIRHDGQEIGSLI